MAGAELNTLVEQHKKEVTSKYVIPIMAIETLLFIVAFVELTTVNILIFAAIIGLNGFVTSKFKSRSDAADLARWIFNICVVDVFLFTTYEPSVVGHYAVWVLLITAAQADTLSKRNQWTVFLIAYFTSITLFSIMHQSLPVVEFLFIFFIMFALFYIYNLSERLWVSEISKRFESQKNEFLAQQREKDLSQQFESVGKNAILGENVRFISHEINNLITIMDLIKSDPNKEQRFQAAQKKLKEITRLVLSDLTGTDVHEVTTVNKLIADVCLLHEKELTTKGVEFPIEVTKEIGEMSFRERKGASFFVLTNLINNSKQALLNQEDAAYLDKEIKLVVSAKDGYISFSLQDNGPGMTQEKIREILAEQGRTTKATGHGIGMRFVIHEIEKNGFRIDIQSTVGQGANITLSVPEGDVKDASQEGLSVA